MKASVFPVMSALLYSTARRLVNSNCAIFFKEKGKAIHKQNRGEAEIAMLKKGSDGIALKINWYALQRQVQAGKGYIVCPQKEVLEQLVKAK